MDDFDHWTAKDFADLFAEFPAGAKLVIESGMERSSFIDGEPEMHKYFRVAVPDDEGNE